MHVWQVPSAVLGLRLAFPLARSLDADRVAREAEAVLSDAAFSPQRGPYHDGSWTRLGLVSPSGDPHRTYGHPDEPKAKTPVLKAMPEVERTLDGFGGPIRSATLSRMAPGAQVRWHRDHRQSIDLAYVRLHIPVFTDAGAVTTIGHETVHMAPGTVWYGDFTFPHRVLNDSPNPRLHIMFDVPSRPELLALFPQAYVQQTRRRRLARKLVTRSFDVSERFSESGRKARAARAEREATRARGEDYAPPAA